MTIRAHYRHVHCPNAKDVSCAMSRCQELWRSVVLGGGWWPFGALWHVRRCGGAEMERDMSFRRMGWGSAVTHMWIHMNHSNEP